jgi:succinoglycan biosynthesis protein ExoA
MSDSGDEKQNVGTTRSNGRRNKVEIKKAGAQSNEQHLLSKRKRSRSLMNQEPEQIASLFQDGFRDGETVRVSVIVPCRNEARHLDAFIASLLHQDLSGVDGEILIADGMSDDATRSILEGYSSRHPQIRLLDNPGRIASTGLNEAIRASKGEILIRMDVHTEYAPDYIQQCVKTLQKTGAENVGGAARTHTKSYMQQAISVAYHTAFAVGGARFHNVEYEGYVDTVTYGCWRKETLMKLGLFDEELVRNQDDELNLRLIRSGGKIWQSPAIRSWYSPRSSLRALFRQYAQYGYWKVRVIQKHKLLASIRHLIPGLFVGSLILLGLLSPFFHGAWIAFLTLGLLYALANGAASLATCCRKETLRCLPVMPLVFGAYHLGYGYGFLSGLLHFVVLKKGASRKFTRTTRI